MPKYLYLQDSHCKGINPARRTDDYYASWMLKFKEMLTIAKKNKVEKIVDGGDTLDQPIISTLIVDEILDAIEANGIPYHVVYGSHSMQGHHRDTSKGSSLAHMIRRSKLMEDSDEIQDEFCTIKLIEHEHNVEQKIKDSGIILDGGDSKWLVAITHCMITPKPFRPEVLHVVADDIVTNAHLILTAHYHQPWERKIKNTQYVDIGCFGRTEISEANINPSVLLLDSKKRSYEIIPLKKAKPGAEVFDLTKKEHDKEVNADLDTFINSLKDFKNQSLDIRGQIELIGKENNVERVVIDTILTKLGEVECLEKK